MNMVLKVSSFNRHWEIFVHTKPSNVPYMKNIVNCEMIIKNLLIFCSKKFIQTFLGLPWLPASGHLCPSQQVHLETQTSNKYPNQTDTIFFCKYHNDHNHCRNLLNNCTAFQGASSGCLRWFHFLTKYIEAVVVVVFVFVVVVDHTSYCCVQNQSRFHS